MPVGAESQTANIHMSFHRELNCAIKQKRATVTPVIVTGAAPGELPDTTKPFDTLAGDLEYEVFCPNCARVESARTHDVFKHKCNCGYGVAVEMLRTSPN